MILELFKENWAIEVNNSSLPPSATKALSHFELYFWTLATFHEYGLYVLRKIRDYVLMYVTQIDFNKFFE